jgi:hypothetical protein
MSTMPASIGSIFLQISFLLSQANYLCPQKQQLFRRAKQRLEIAVLCSNARFFLFKRENEQRGLEQNPIMLHHTLRR